MVYLVSLSEMGILIRKERIELMGKIKRIGLITPHTDMTSEYDLRRELPAHYIIHTERMWLEDVTIESEKKMLEEELPRAITYIKDLNLDLVIFGCTSAGAIYGPKGDKKIVDMIAKETKCPVISAYGAVNRQLKETEGEKVAVMTPYIESVMERVVESLQEEGASVSTSVGMGIINDIEIGSLKPDEIEQFIMKHKDQIKDNDTLFMSCTNLRAVESIESLSSTLQMRVISSNSAIISEVKKLMDE